MKNVDQATPGTTDNASVSLSQENLELIRGRAATRRATPEDVILLLKYIDILEDFLDDVTDGDLFGVEGWRNRLGFED